MKILFVYTNVTGFHTDTYSIGLASIMSFIRLKGHEIRVVIVRTKDDYYKVWEENTCFKPQVIGFSSVSSQFSIVKELAAGIKERSPGIIAVCGGVHPTINPGCLLETRNLDAIFIGESENSFAEFIEKIEQGRPYEDTENLAFIKDGRLIVNKLKPLVMNLEMLPYPDREVYPFGKILEETGYAHFVFSRGCPFLCTYCSNHAIAKAYNLPRNITRFRSAEDSIKEIEAVINKFKVGRIIIGDEIFGLDKKWRYEFCEKYKKRVRIKFHSMFRVNFIDEETLKLLKDAGCYRITLSVESGNDFVRRQIMNREMTNKQIIKAFDLAHKYGIETCALNMIGLPGETEEMIWDTIKLNRRIMPTDSGINIFYPYKGTKLGDSCFEKNFVDEQIYDSFCNERRDTVLKYPESYKKRLNYFRKNWDYLIYPFYSKKIIRKIIAETFLGNIYYFLKRFCKLFAIPAQISKKDRSK